MTAEEYFGDWLKVIDSFEMKRVLNFLRSINPDNLCPAYNNIFKAFNLCPYNNCKVVFIGQDPYPQRGVATGILFGNKPGTKELSPSLEVIKEACIDYNVPHGPIEFDITLESWARQGILMINSALTCEVGKVNSHMNVWRTFLSKLLRNLSEHESGIIYVLFGTRARTLKPYINKSYNDIIEVEHPAYFARTGQTMPHNIFTDINALLKHRYGTTIEWYHELSNINIENNERKETTDGDDFFWPCSL